VRHDGTGVVGAGVERDDEAHIGVVDHPPVGGERAPDALRFVVGGYDDVQAHYGLLGVAGLTAVLRAGRAGLRHIRVRSGAWARCRRDPWLGGRALASTQRALSTRTRLRRKGLPL